MPLSATAAIDPPGLLTRLESLCRGNDLGSLAERLADLAAFVESDVARFEAATPRPRTNGATHVERGARHLLDLGGKRLRPICVALAARLGTGFDQRALSLAIAVELVHAATLLHDDVVDLGETRRGAPATRAIYGNAISIFAGDWLLIDALRRVRGSGIAGVLEHLLDVIEEMIFAESLQLEQRGRLDTTSAQWLEVVEGKTAALFRWAMVAGGRAGGLNDEACAALERYGRHLGVAFQAVDDLLDLTGDPSATGKALFTDLREGKLTYPLIVAQERDPALRGLLEQAVRGEATHALAADIVDRLARSGALDEGRRLALTHAARAKETLRVLPAGRARDALETVADATVHRPS